MKEDNVYNNNFDKTPRVTRIVNNLCKENSEKLVRNTNEDLNRSKEEWYAHSWLSGPIKMLLIPKLIYKFYFCSVKIPVMYFLT